VLGAMRKDLSAFGWSPEEFARFFDRIGWNDLTLALPVERTLLFAAEKDHFFDADVLRTMWGRWGEPEIHWYRTTHMGFIPHMPGAISRLRRFVRALPPR